MHRFRRPRLARSLVGIVLDWLADLSIAHEARKAAKGRRPTLSAEYREREAAYHAATLAELRGEAVIR